MEAQALPWWKQTFEILKAAGKEFGEDKASRMAAALSYYTIFSLVPLLFIVVAVAGFVSSAQAQDPSSGTSYTHELISYVEDVAGGEIAGQIEDIIDQIEEQAGGALSIGIVLALFSASTIFAQVQGVLSVIFQVPEDQRRSGIVGTLVQRGIGAVAASLLAVLAFAPIVAVGAVSLIPASWGAIQTLAQFSVPVLALLVLMGVAGLTFQTMTAIEIPWKAAIRGGAATALIGLVAAYLVGLYLSQAGSSNGPSVSALGVLGGAVVLLFFFNLMWTVYLFGAEVTKVYGDYLEFGDIVQPSERTARQHPELDRIHPIRRSQADGIDVESAAKTGVTAFVLGALFGWIGGRRS